MSTVKCTYEQLEIEILDLLPKLGKGKGERDIIFLFPFFTRVKKLLLQEVYCDELPFG